MRSTNTGATQGGADNQTGWKRAKQKVNMSILCLEGGGIPAF